MQGPSTSHPVAVPIPGAEGVEGVEGDVDRGMRSALASLTLQGLTLSAKFLLIVVLAGRFGAKDLGLYGLMTSALAIGVFACGMEYHYFTRRELVVSSDAGRVVLLRDQLLLHLVVLAGGLSLVAAFGRGPLSAVLPREIQRWFFPLVVVELLSLELAQALIALSKPVIANVTLFIRQGAWALPVAVVALTAKDQPRLSLVFVGSLLGDFAALLVGAWVLRHLPWRDNIRKAIDLASIGVGIRVAAPYVVATGASMGLLFLDRFIINAYRGVEAVGIYTFFASIAVAVHTLVYSSVAIVRLPRILLAERRGAQAMRREIISTARMSLLVTVPLAGSLSLTALVGLSRYAPPAYRGATTLFLFLLLGAVARCLADVFLFSLYAERRHGLLLAINLCGCALSVSLNFALIPEYGTLGAGVASLMSSGLILVVAATSVGRRYWSPA